MRYITPHILDDLRPKSLLYYAERLKPQKATQITAHVRRPYSHGRIRVTDPLSYFHSTFFDQPWDLYHKVLKDILRPDLFSRVQGCFLWMKERLERSMIESWWCDPISSNPCQVLCLFLFPFAPTSPSPFGNTRLVFIDEGTPGKVPYWHQKMWNCFFQPLSVTA